MHRRHQPTPKFDSSLCLSSSSRANLRPELSPPAQSLSLPITQGAKATYTILLHRPHGPPTAQTLGREQGFCEVKDRKAPQQGTSGNIRDHLPTLLFFSLSCRGVLLLFASNRCQGPTGGEGERDKVFPKVWRRGAGWLSSRVLRILSFFALSHLHPATSHGPPRPLNLVVFSSICFSPFFFPFFSFFFFFLLLLPSSSLLLASPSRSVLWQYKKERLPRDTAQNTSCLTWTR